MTSPKSRFHANARSPFRCLIAACVAFGAQCCSAPQATQAPTRTAPKAEAPPRNATTPDPTAWRLAPPSPGPASHLVYPTPEVTTLSNGLRVYVLPRASGPVAMSAITLRDDPRESDDTSGLGSLTAELLAEATQKKNHAALSEAAESLGSTLHGDAGRDFIRIAIDTLPADAEKGLALLAESLTQPAFDRKDFERLRAQRLDELLAERQNPSRLASVVGLRMLLGPLQGNPVSGCPKAIKKLRLDDVKQWHRRWVTPKNTAVILVGPIDVATANSLSERIFGKWRSAPTPNKQASKESLPESQQTVYLLDRPGSVQSAIFTVQRFPKRIEAGYIAREHLDNILGGLFTSRINHNLREVHGYTYGARTATVATRTFGLFTVSTNVETDVTVASIREIFSELTAIAGPNPTSPIETDELSRSQADLVQGLGAHLEESHRMLSDLEQLFLYELPTRYFADYASAVASVTSSDVTREAERLSVAKTLVVVVGDGDRIRPELQRAGFAVTAAQAQCLED